MPSIFEGLDAAGQGAMGAQQYMHGQNSLALQQQRLQAGRLAMAEAQRQMAEEQAGRERAEGYRTAMREAIQTIGKLDTTRAAMHPVDTSTPWAAALGVGRNYAEVAQWLKGKDDPTQQALDKLRSIAAKVAETSPDQALNVLEIGGAEIKQRVVEAAVNSFKERAATQLSGLQAAAQDGGLPPNVAEQLSGAIQTAMELVEANPAAMGQAEALLAKTYQAADQALQERDEKVLAMQQLEHLSGSPSGVPRPIIDGALRAITLGVDPRKALDSIYQQLSVGWRGGRLEDAPPQLRSQWDAEAEDLARAYVTEQMPDADFRSDLRTRMAEIEEATQSVLGQFKRQVYARNGVQMPAINPMQDYGGAVGNKAPAAKPKAPPVKAEAVKRKKGERKTAFIKRVLEQAAREGRDGAWIGRSLEAEGITPEDVKAAQGG